jgi:ABC-type sugar transport system ATPase subunit
VSLGRSEPRAVPALRVENIGKKFGPNWAVRGVSFAIQPGEVLGLVGDNGAGKSTLIGMLSGNLAPDSGSIVVEGTERVFSQPNDARLAGIETVYQNLSLVLGLDIASNIFLKRELLHRGSASQAFHWIDKRKMVQEADATLRDLGLVLPTSRTRVAALSGGQRQAIAVARSVYWGTRIVLMDEPAASLGVRQTELVLSLLRKLKTKNIATMFVSHNMHHILEVCDRVVVLRTGRVVLSLPRAEITTNILVAAITGLDDTL